MNYELAKQLKDAGFLQDIRWGKFVYSPDGKRQVCTRKAAIAKDNEIDPATPDLILDPTLEELIEACGDVFHLLERRNDNGRWIAFKTTDRRGIEFAGVEANTPTEAAACLWLSLNKK